MTVRLELARATLAGQISALLLKRLKLIVQYGEKLLLHLKLQGTMVERKDSEQEEEKYAISYRQTQASKTTKRKQPERKSTVAEPTKPKKLKKAKIKRIDLSNLMDEPVIGSIVAIIAESDESSRSFFLGRVTEARPDGLSLVSQGAATR